MAGAFTSEECELCASALEHAWEIFLKAGRLTPQNNDIAKAALAQAVLDAAAFGNRNARQIAIVATASFDKYEDTIRRQRSWSLPLQHAS